MAKKYWIGAIHVDATGWAVAVTEDTATEEEAMDQVMENYEPGNTELGDPQECVEIREVSEQEYKEFRRGH